MVMDAAAARCNAIFYIRREDKTYTGNLLGFYANTWGNPVGLFLIKLLEVSIVQNQSTSNIFQYQTPFYHIE